jgi:hypothetical protein
MGVIFMLVVRHLACAGALAACLATPAVAAAPAGYITAIAAGQPDPNGKVPSYNSVPGAGVDNMSVPATQAMLTHGLNYVVSIALQDATYTGNVEVLYTITQKVGAKTETLQKMTINKSFASKPGNYWLWAIIGPAIPNKPGAASLNGYAIFGSKTVKLNVPIVIQ